MPNPRIPVQKAKATGADIKNPKRHSGRAAPKVAPLGAPPRHLTEAQAEVWRTFAEEMPWLAKSDRAIVETATVLRARLMQNPEMGVNALAQLRMCLSVMGGTPADRSKVGDTGDEDDDDESARFFQ